VPAAQTGSVEVRFEFDGGSLAGTLQGRKLLKIKHAPAKAGGATGGG
jgi:hypothetical protein